MIGEVLHSSPEIIYCVYTILSKRIPQKTVLCTGTSKNVYGEKVSCNLFNKLNFHIF